VDARDSGAFTRVFDALCAGMTTGRYEDKTGRIEECPSK
jgi:hypothetical protein